MRFFTRQWHNGELSEEESQAVPLRYAAHLETLRPKLPMTLLTLAFGTYLHDGLLRGVGLDRAQRTLAIGLRCGDLHLGYFDVDLVYKEVSLPASSLSELEAAARDPERDCKNKNGSPICWNCRLPLTPLY